MKLSVLLSRFDQRLGGCSSRGCARPCVMNGPGVCRFALFRGAGGGLKVALLPPLFLTDYGIAPDIRLTTRAKTLQSP